MESPFEQLLAKQAITEVIYQYCRAIDRLDRVLALECWHPGGTVDFGHLYKGTAAGFVTWAWPQYEELRVHSHQVTNILIELDGDRAVSESYVTIVLREGRGDAARDIVNRGRFLDVWTRRGEDWRMLHRGYVNDIASVLVPESAAEPAASRRDGTDPSYDLYLGVDESVSPHARAG